MLGDDSEGDGRANMKKEVSEDKRKGDEQEILPSAKSTSSNFPAINNCTFIGFQYQSQRTKVSSKISIRSVLRRQAILFLKMAIFELILIGFRYHPRLTMLSKKSSRDSRRK